MVHKTGLAISVVVCALTMGCAQSRHTLAFSSHLLGYITEEGVVLDGEKLAVGAPKQELPQWCHPIGEHGFECANVRLAEPWIVSLWRDGRVMQITLWELQGPSDFICRLYNSIDLDFRQLVGPPKVTLPCECSEFGCRDHQSSAREWRLKSGVTLGLWTSVHPERPRAPDGTPFSRMSVWVAEPGDSE